MVYVFSFLHNMFYKSGDSAGKGHRAFRGGMSMKFYTIKLPKFLGGFVKALLNTFQKN